MAFTLMRAFDQSRGHQLLRHGCIHDRLHVRDHLGRARGGGGSSKSLTFGIFLRAQGGQAFGVGRRDGGQFLRLLDGVLERGIVEIVDGVRSRLAFARHGDRDGMAQDEGRGGDAVVREPRIGLFGVADVDLAFRECRESNLLCASFCASSRVSIESVLSPSELR